MQEGSHLWLVASSPDAARGIGALYTELLQPARAVQTDFLRGLVSHFQAACSLHDKHGSVHSIRQVASPTDS